MSIHQEGLHYSRDTVRKQHYHPQWTQRPVVKGLVS